MAGDSMAVEKVEEIVIVGGGIAGLATAVALRRVGKPSLVLERWHELRESGSCITLSLNAWRALDAIGVGHKLKPRYLIHPSGRVTNLVTRVTQIQSFVQNADGREETGARIVHRKALLEAIAQELPPEAIRFSSKLSSIRAEVLPDTSIIHVLHLEDGSTIKAKAVIGCDGVHSVVAQWLGLAAPRGTGRSAIRGLGFFPDGHGYEMAIQQFISTGVRGGFAPINDKDVYWFLTHLTTPQVHEMGREPELIVKTTLKDLAPDFPPEFKEVVRRSDLSTLSWVTLHFRSPWSVLVCPARRGCVTVAGDAFHPMTPDLGQGGGIALEDAVVLARCLARAGSARETEEGMAQYVAARRWRAAAVIMASFFSGFVQQASGGPLTRLVKLVRDLLFYRFIFPWIARIASFDCGTLPEVKK